MMHNSMTMFFSDIVDFTGICKEISPWQVIDMLNDLYGIMDFLAGKFRLFKIETIGDAYVCASGLPTSDPVHAINVADFAVAVHHCCRKVILRLSTSNPPAFELVSTAARPPLESSVQPIQDIVSLVTPSLPQRDTKVQGSLAKLTALKLPLWN